MDNDDKAAPLSKADEDLLREYLRKGDRSAVWELDMELDLVRVLLATVDDLHAKLAEATLAIEDTEAAGFVRHLETLFPISDKAKPMLERELGKYLQLVRMDVDAQLADAVPRESLTIETKESMRLAEENTALRAKLAELQKDVNAEYWDKVRDENIDLRARLAEARDLLSHYVKAFMPGPTTSAPEGKAMRWIEKVNEGMRENDGD